MSPLLSIAQARVKKNAVAEIQLKYDTLQATQFYNSFKIGLRVKKYNGKETIVEGSYSGYTGWDKFNITVQNGVFRNGQIFFDWKQVYHHGHQITLQITPKNNPAHQAVFRIEIPYITRIAFRANSFTTLFPGFGSTLEILAFYSNGHVYSTAKQAIHTHHLPAEHFKIQYQNYSSTNGILFLPARLLPYPERIHVKATYLADTTITTQVDLPVSYRANYTFNFAAAQGSAGISGQNAQGCSQRDGRDGQHGQKGQRGQRGKTVKVYAKTLIQPSDTLIQVKAITDSQSEHVLLHPSARIMISCNGGNGGEGGQGGRGSDGLDETDIQPAGYGGNGGDGGEGGEGGEGGKVVIYTDSLTLPFVERMLRVQNSGGKGGQGGRGGARGRGGIRNGDKSFLTALGNLVGVGSGASGNTGYKGQDGEDGLEKETILLPSAKLNAFF